MANIAISELETEATVLNNDDLILVSKKNGTSFTSAKMKAGVVSDMIAQSTQILNTNITDIKLDTTAIKNDLSDIKETLTVHTSYLSSLTDLCTRIGNKIFSGEYGENKTLTLTRTTGLNVPEPTGSGTYPKGTRVIITANTPIDPTLVKFSGWYQDNVLIDNGKQSSLSYEVTSDITLNAKYYTTTYIRGKIKIINNSSYPFRIYQRYNNSDPYFTKSVEISKNSTVTIESFFAGDRGTNPQTYYSLDGWMSYYIDEEDVNISSSKSGVTTYMIPSTTDENGSWGIRVASSASIENYDGTYKDYGTITITNK